MKRLAIILLTLATCAEAQTFEDTMRAQSRSDFKLRQELTHFFAADGSILTSSHFASVARFSGTYTVNLEDLAHLVALAGIIDNPESTYFEAHISDMYGAEGEYRIERGSASQQFLLAEFKKVLAKIDAESKRAGYPGWHNWIW